jgi:hypothetical protein
MRTGVADLEHDRSPRDDSERILSAQDLLAGSALVHDVVVPPETLAPGKAGEPDVGTGIVRVRPLSIAALATVSRAARDDPGLIPVLILKQALVEPTLEAADIQGLHVGLVQFLLDRINVISGLTDIGESENTLGSPLGETHLMLAKHFGWTPEQVGQLTPGQVAVYLAGVQRLLDLEQQGAVER